MAFLLFLVNLFVADRGSTDETETFQRQLNWYAIP